MCTVCVWVRVGGVLEEGMSHLHVITTPRRLPLFGALVAAAVVAAAAAAAAATTGCTAAG